MKNFRKMHAEYFKYFENVRTFFLLVFYSFFQWSSFISKKLFQNFGRLYLVKKSAGEATFAFQWGPDTHNTLYQRGAAIKNKPPFSVQKNSF